MKAYLCLQLDSKTASLHHPAVSCHWYSQLTDFSLFKTNLVTLYMISSCSNTVTTEQVEY